MEAWWLDRARMALGYAEDDALLRGLEKDAGRLSDLFTTDRKADFGGYGENERMLLAYGLFYFPQTFQRIRYPLRELLFRTGWQPAGGTIRGLELGAGTGGALLGAVDYLAAAFPEAAIEAQAVDRSRGSLALLSDLTRELRDRWPRATFRTSVGDMRTEPAWPPEGFDFILASFSLGEAFLEDQQDRGFHQWITAIRSRLRPGGWLLLVEPALKVTSERLERLRDQVAQENHWRIVAPCLHRESCPLLPSGEHWCHEVRSWDPPRSVVLLNRHLARSIQTLKYSFLALTAAAEVPAGEPAEANSDRFRLISPVAEVKGRLIAAGCAADGRRYTYEIPTRHLSREDRKRLLAWDRGDIVSGPFVPLGDGTVRRLNGTPEDLRHESAQHTGNPSA